MSGRTLIVISAKTRTAAAAIAAGRSPRKDFVELARAVDADVLDLDEVAARARWRLVQRLAGSAVALCATAFSRRARYDRIYCDGEHIGIPLALLLRLCRHRPRHLFIGHLLTTPLKRALFRWLRPQRGLDRIIVHTPLQRRLAVERLSIPPSVLALEPYGVDTDYWRPCDSVDADNLICSAGLEFRDYRTMLSAVADLRVKVVIAAGSRWSTHRLKAGGGELPAQVDVTQLDYPDLRDLYARSRFVVVPLEPVLNQAGITTILEAMAMGKAVIVSATPGQQDVIHGRLCTANGLSASPLGGPSAFGVMGALAEAETGLYVPPGDAAALRRAIVYLLDHPEDAARMGRAGRRLVEERMSLDLFVSRLATLIRGVQSDGLAKLEAAPARATSRGVPAKVSGDGS
jgi:glycosyltransferase involved in cell wall biosynthesis